MPSRQFASIYDRFENVKLVQLAVQWLGFAIYPIFELGLVHISPQPIKTPTPKPWTLLLKSAVLECPHPNPETILVASLNGSVIASGSHSVILMQHLDHLP